MIVEYQLCKQYLVLIFICLCKDFEWGKRGLSRYLTGKETAMNRLRIDFASTTNRLQIDANQRLMNAPFTG
jgi:hypothetical protein